METLAAEVLDLAEKRAEEQGVQMTWNWQDVFPAVCNDDEACTLVRSAAHHAGITVVASDTPFRWSEDFAHYGRHGHAALVGLGSGETCAPLHAEDYVFPDALLPIGVSFLQAVVRAAFDHS